MRSGYRGRLAPSPTGFLHVGHARTFWMAEERAVSAGGTLILRNEDLDPAMPITEVVRGADLLVSTARQLMLFRALDLQPPAFYHCPLVTNKAGQRLAKRDAALSLRALRGQGFTPEAVRQMW